MSRTKRQRVLDQQKGKKTEEVVSPPVVQEPVADEATSMEVNTDSGISLSSEPVVE